jgi:transcriptional regulator with XRE-family HTH domain
VANLLGPKHLAQLGAYIREQRENAQYSLRQLAQAAGVSNPYLSQIERGLRKPSAEILQQLAKALEISAETMYVRAGLLESTSEAVRGGAEAAAGTGAGTSAGTGGSGAVSRVIAAIADDPALTRRQKLILREIYESFRTGTPASEAGLADAETNDDSDPAAAADTDAAGHES